ncbi:MAG: NTP transferase domain-containing protein [Chitinophagaceae bacterium]|nr:NTP transferase domain-containing protein [Chitinophagaceae bacterium]
MKAIIPVAGAGTKLRPHTYTQPKALIPLAGRTLLSIIIDQLREGGISEFILIVGHLGDKIQDFVQLNYPGLDCRFVYQSDRCGLGHAIWLTRDDVGDDEILIALGDTICRSFGVAELDEEGAIVRVVEKPQIPKSNLALVGLYKIQDTRMLFECLESNLRQGRTNRDEYSLTDALECMIHRGAAFRPFRVNNWFDCGKKESLLESNATLLKKFGGEISDDHVFENVIIIPPVSIARGCEVRNSIIGPNVAIGERTVINYSIVRDSIIGSFSKLFDVVLNDSLIGSDTEIKGETRTLNIGDNTEIDLG